MQTGSAKPFSTLPKTSAMLGRAEREQERERGWESEGEIGEKSGTSGARWKEGGGGGGGRDK